MLSPLYRLRRRRLGAEFRYGMNKGRFHTSDILDGRRARDELGYTPQRGFSHPDSV
jgi:hypothetical protein